MIKTMGPSTEHWGTPEHLETGMIRVIVVTICTLDIGLSLNVVDCYNINPEMKVTIQ